MDQWAIRERRTKLERRVRVFREALIKTGEELIQLESICKNPIHNIKGKNWICPDCRKIHKRKRGIRNGRKTER